jgi:hypothetical protein
MTLRDWREKYSKREKAFVVLFCLFCFLTSNVVEIRGGACSSSPCSKKDVSDYFGKIVTRPFVTPTGLFLPLILDAAGYSPEEGVHVGVNAFAVSYFWKPNLFYASAPVLILEFEFDKKPLFEEGILHSEREHPEYKEYVAALNLFDRAELPKAYILIKAVVLLSFPWWLFISFFLLKMRRTKKYVFYVFTTYFFITGLWLLLNVYFEMITGSPLVTWSYLSDAFVNKF